MITGIYSPLPKLSEVDFSLLIEEVSMLMLLPVKIILLWHDLHSVCVFESLYVEI
jgi:hypothetical protein